MKIVFKSISFYLCRSQLSNAFKEIADLKHTATEHISKIEVLESLVEEKTVENNTLMEEYNKVNQQRYVLFIWFSFFVHTGEKNMRNID